VGEIIDMASAVLVSVRIVDVVTGKILWTDEITEKLASYDYIGAYFAKGILIYFQTPVGKSVARRVAVKLEKKEEAVVELSKGIAAYERNDTETARTILKEAARLDPDSEVAKYYLTKLLTNTTKYKVIAESYYSYENPAYLGMLKVDRLFWSSGGNYFFELYL